MLSVVIPALNETAALPGLLDDLARLGVAHEVIVDDGGSTDGTPGLALSRGARAVAGARGRGAQLAEGAAAARGRVLCFLHADVRLDVRAIRALERCVDMPDGEARTFTLHIAAHGWRYRLVEWGARWRSRWGRLPYGDQGLVLTRATYDRAGGFAPLPLMEDVDFILRLRRDVHVSVLRERITVSARRWQREGVLRRTLRNWMLLGAYLAGAAPAALARRYRPWEENTREH